VTAGERRGVRYERSLGPADVGARVMVRRRLSDGQLGDVLGQLEQWSEQVLVRDRHGVVHAMRQGDVVAGKRIPPPPAAR
jgi:hypothetical protein